MHPNRHALAIYAPDLMEPASDGEAGTGEAAGLEAATRPSADLDARQDDVLRRLDELNEQIEAVIREFLPPGTETDSRSAVA